MRRFLIIPVIVLLITPFTGEAITGNDTRFDWSLGIPAITADNTNTCNDTAQARFDWVLGEPALVHDSTANCTAAGGGTPIGNSTFYIKNGGFYIKNGGFYKKN